MGVERFRGESPINLENKCLCTLVVDVSGSMDRSMDELNTALKSFFWDIENDNNVPEMTKEKLEICVIAFDENVHFLRNPCLLERGEVPPTLVNRGSTTGSVKALEAAIQMTLDRKEFYKETGQSYYRPWIVFMTDGEPYPYNESDVSAIEARIKHEVAKNSYHILGLGVGRQISEKTLRRLTADEAMALEGTNFGKFFRWLSNSMSMIVSSEVGQKVDTTKGQSEWMRKWDK